MSDCYKSHNANRSTLPIRKHQKQRIKFPGRRGDEKTTQLHHSFLKVEMKSLSYSITNRSQSDELELLACIGRLSVPSDFNPFLEECSNRLSHWHCPSSTAEIQ
ncbi:MAG: hypothetical protein ACRC62_25615 [Microcoleus sp.]